MLSVTEDDVPKSASAVKVPACDAVARSIIEAGGSAEAHALHVGEPEAIEAVFAALDAAGRAYLRRLKRHAFSRGLSICCLSTHQSSRLP